MKPLNRLAIAGRGGFVPYDFSAVIAHVPDGCPLIGGQGVSWWAGRYGLKIRQNGQLVEVTSHDIDFWGSRADLVILAKALGRRAVFPHPYEMSLWTGAIELKVNDEETVAEFLHTVPGLDTIDPQAAAVPQLYDSPRVRRTILVLTPISLALTKLHALRHFDQTHRQDEAHLRVCLEASRLFLAEFLQQEAVRAVLWNCERLLYAHELKPYAKLEKVHKFNILDAIPIEEMKKWVKKLTINAENREKISNFVSRRWKRLVAN